MPVWFRKGIVKISLQRNGKIEGDEDLQGAKLVWKLSRFGWKGRE